MKQHLLLALLAFAIPAAAAPAMEPGRVETKVGHPVDLRYLVHRPAKTEGKLPLVIFLHGSGERGEDLNLLKVHGPLKLIANGSDIPAIVAAPQCPAGKTWDPLAVKALTDHLVATEAVDPARILLTGISMGGFGTWGTALAYPDTFAAIAPICGGAGIGILEVGKIAKLPCWIFHGKDDEVVPARFSEQMAAALEKVKAPVKLTLYPGVGHDSWTRTYEDPAFWEWFLSQRR